MSKATEVISSVEPLAALEHRGEGAAGGGFPRAQRQRSAWHGRLGATPAICMDGGAAAASTIAAGGELCSSADCGGSRADWVAEPPRPWRSRAAKAFRRRTGGDRSVVGAHGGLRGLLGSPDDRPRPLRRARLARDRVQRCKSQAAPGDHPIAAGRRLGSARLCSYPAETPVIGRRCT